MAAAKLERSLHRIGRYRIHALHTGAGAPLVLLHGLSGSARWWRNNVPALADHFRTHTPDLVGFGSSRTWASQPSIPQMAELLEQWLDINEIERTHLIGHSMGGQIAIHIAAERPQRVDKLVLVSAAGIPRPLTLSAITRFVAEVVPPRGWGKPTFLPTVAADALRAGPRSLLGAANRLLRDDVSPLLPEITAPTLLVWGRLDPLTPLAHGELMAQQITGSRLLVFDDAAHMPMVDAPDRFNREVLGFLLGDEGLG
ncbi:MAG TPA: alpha/beta hydrolase [Longimicrobiales bacterium]